MVTRAELAIELIKWVALFIPALAIMMNTLTDVYDQSLLEVIGFAELRKKESIRISLIAFGTAFAALILAFLYLVESLDLLATSPILGFVLLLAIALSITAAGVTIFILYNFYKATNLSQINNLNELEEMAESDPEQVAALLNMAGEQKQISQRELDLLAEEIGLFEKLEQNNEKSTNDS